MKSIPFILLDSASSKRFKHEKLRVPLFKGVTGYRGIIDVSRFQDDINHITGDRWLRVLLKKYREELKKITWHDDSFTWDIDTPGLCNGYQTFITLAVHYD